MPLGDQITLGAVGILMVGWLVILATKVLPDVLQVIAAKPKEKGSIKSARVKPHLKRVR